MSLSRTSRRLHRWLGLAFSLFTFMAAGSGLIHNLMSATQPPPPAAAPAAPVPVDQITLGPAEAVERSGIDPDQITSISVRVIAGEPWYQILADREFIYVHGSSGEVDPDADARYAGEIASRALGGAEVRRTDFLTSYNSEYIAIFRLLPVHRFDVDDGRGTRVYVSTITGSVARHTDDRKQWQADVFGRFHKFNFIADPKLRNPVMTVTTSGIALAALSGIVLFTTTPGRKRRR